MRLNIRKLTLLTLPLIFGACGGGSQPTDSEEISISFSSSPEYLLAGEAGTLTWEAEGSSFCTIPGVFEEDEEGDVSDV